ncbi:MAG: alpha-amylase family glycosyl hydrolase [Gammaproteobacteria bacterium]|nr:alpha-amylase family glycosyl hydrolase [Gammaproteobacteria bacterium]MDH3768199.1 alpha-amylase family glycosyl hydrolase [Gammaproteobacteria bacterium]
MTRSLCQLAIVLALCGCARTPDTGSDSKAAPSAEYYGTLAPFASEAVYFVLTDRFVDGDPGNNYVEQGAPDRHTFDRPITDLHGNEGNIGYMGGDFRGLLDNADYIADMGFTAVWITPIVENPDEAFMGGHKLGEGFFADNGKTGYHGYWGVNFFETDEHLVSDRLGFAELTTRLRDDHGLKTVLDIVCNHGSPSYTMPEDQPGYGEIYDAAGKLVADHQNLLPENLDDSNRLHAWFHHEGDLAQLSNIDENNSEVLDYFVDAYSRRIEEGAAAFRIDTIKHMPHSYWKAFSDRIRIQHPDFFMFSESFEFNAAKVAAHTWPENGGISVLDFPGQKSMNEVFTDPDSAFVGLSGYLHLKDGVYQNPYELMTFYDNHDMPRMDADENGFIDAHNWMFTSRGIPVIYYGSESMFRPGAAEHGGNRDYFGNDNIELARKHPVRAALRHIAQIRRQSPALQRGLQVNVDLTGDSAVFYRVYQKDGVNQTALVLLNKGDESIGFRVTRWLSTGAWRDAVSGDAFAVNADASVLQAEVPAHGVRVLLFDAPVDNVALAVELDALQAGAVRRAN